MYILGSLIVLLTFLTIISYYLSEKDILSTPVTLCLAFLGTCAMALAYAEVWLLSLSYMTALVVFVGVSSYLLGYFLWFYYKNRTEENLISSKDHADEIHVSKIATCIFVVLELVSIYGSYTYMDNVVSMFLSTNNLVEKIGMFHIVIMDQDITSNMSIPPKGRLYGWLEDLCCVGSFIYMYILAHDHVYRAKVKWYFIPIIILYLCNSLLTGGRFNTVATLMGLGIFYYVFNKRKNNWNLGITFKQAVKYGVLLVVMLLFFPMSMVLLGRSDMEITVDTIGIVFKDVMYNLAVYVGAEIKLLNTFVTETYINARYDDPIASHTLSTLYGKIGNAFNIPSWRGVGAGDIPFDSVNGNFLGNVYTMFRPYMTDGGFIGVFIFSFIMGVVFAYFYYKVRYKYSGSIDNKIDFNLLVYGWIYYCVPLSFFSNWFYGLLAPSLLRMALCFYICRFFILKNDE